MSVIAPHPLKACKTQQECSGGRCHGITFVTRYAPKACKTQWKCWIWALPRNNCCCSASSQSMYNIIDTLKVGAPTESTLLLGIFSKHVKHNRNAKGGHMGERELRLSPRPHHTIFWVRSECAVSARWVRAYSWWVRSHKSECARWVRRWVRWPIRNEFN